MKRIHVTVLVGLAVFFIPFVAHSATWQIDPAHSNFEFKIRHLTVSNVKGNFTKASGTITADDQDIANLKVEVMIDAASVNTSHTARDEHLRGPDFFDVKKYPNITFTSRKVITVDKGRLKVVGDLTIRDVTREISVDVEGPTPEVKDPSGRFRRGATAATKISRRDFGIIWNRVLDTGGVVVGDDVNISVEIEMIRK